MSRLDDDFSIDGDFYEFRPLCPACEASDYLCIMQGELDAVAVDGIAMRCDACKHRYVITPDVTVTVQGRKY